MYISKSQTNLTRIEVLTGQDEMASLMPEWTALYEQSRHTLFQNPAWHQIWWNTIGHREGWRPHIVTGRLDGRLVAIAPFAVRRARGLRILEWAGAQVFDYPDILAIDGVDVPGFWQSIRRTRGFDVAIIRYVRDDARSDRALRALARRIGTGSPAYAINLPYQAGEAWLASLSKRKRANHVASIRLIEKHGPLAMNVVSRRADIPRLVAELISMKDTWGAMRGIVNELSRPGRPEFMQQLALQVSEEGSLHLSLLTCGDRTIAMHYGFVGRDGMYYYQPAYDVAFAKSSVGRVHRIMLVLWAIDNGYHRFDFLRGEDSYKTDFATEARRLNEYMFARGPLGTAAAQLYAVRHQIGRNGQVLADH